jgi:hypothetical protein
VIGTLAALFIHERDAPGATASAAAAPATTLLR